MKNFIFILALACCFVGAIRSSFASTLSCTESLEIISIPKELNPKLTKTYKFLVVAKNRHQIVDLVEGSMRRPVYVSSFSVSDAGILSVTVDDGVSSIIREIPLPDSFYPAVAGVFGLIKPNNEYLILKNAEQNNNAIILPHGFFNESGHVKNVRLVDRSIVFDFVQGDKTREMRTDENWSGRIEIVSDNKYNKLQDALKKKQITLITTTWESFKGQVVSIEAVDNEFEVSIEALDYAPRTITLKFSQINSVSTFR